ncbi:hypothetical protein VTO42DRAFT_3395 [Malbranchea cinnamomea]
MAWYRFFKQLGFDPGQNLNLYCDNRMVTGILEADLFTKEEFSEVARVGVAKAKLSSDIHRELNLSGNVIETYVALQALEVDFFTEEEFSESARVGVAKAKLSSDIHWELNLSSKVIETYVTLQSEVSRLENIFRDQKKLEAPRDKGLNRKLSDPSLKKRGLSTS